MILKTVLLDASHKKQDFHCGKESLDFYIQKQAGQDIKRQLTACFVFAETDGRIIGYYTLSSDSVRTEIIPEEVRKKMPPSYQKLPATLLGRLAVDKAFEKRGYGELLLLDALKKAYATSVSTVGSMAVVVDPLDTGAFQFYAKYGFISLPESGRMFLPMKTISTLFQT